MFNTYFRKVNKDPVKITREHVARTYDHSICLWCSGPLDDTTEMWCSEYCNSQFLLRTSTDHISKIVYDRDLGICSSCGKLDPPYILRRWFRPEDGGSQATLDTVKTLCEKCCTDYPHTLPSIVNQNDLVIPDTTTFKNLWKSTGSKYLEARFLLGPLMPALLEWQLLAQDYKTKFRVIPRTELIEQTKILVTLLQTTIRWWDYTYKESSKKERNVYENLIAKTREYLYHHYEVCLIWAHHFKLKGKAYL